MMHVFHMVFVDLRDMQQMWYMMIDTWCGYACCAKLSETVITVHDVLLDIGFGWRRPLADGFSCQLLETLFEDQWSTYWTFNCWTYCYSKSDHLYFLETAFFAAIAFQNEIPVLGQLCKFACITRNQYIQSLSLSIIQVHTGSGMNIKHSLPRFVQMSQWLVLNFRCLVVGLRLC